jgi:hypothetical protein
MCVGMGVWGRLYVYVYGRMYESFHVLNILYKHVCNKCALNMILCMEMQQKAVNIFKYIDIP